MRPFYFGSSQCALYGMLHPAVKQAENKNEAVLLCYPFGQEYMRAHRTYRQIAVMLSKKGYHTMRFDYRGTGDSNGELETAQPKDWITDIHAAIDELQESTRVEKISLIGLRVGALLAGTVAGSRKIERLVLWDPSLSGRSYVAELKSKLRDAEKDEVSDANFVDVKGTLHFNGFPMSEGFSKDLEGFDLVSVTPQSKKILQIVSHNNAQFETLKRHWGNMPGYQYMLAPAPGDWNYVDDYGGILLPQPVVQGIVNWF